MVERDLALETKIGDYFKATKPTDRDLGQELYGQEMVGSELEDHLIECIYRGTGSDRDMDEEVYDVLDSPGMYADMAYQVLRYLEARGVKLN